MNSLKLALLKFEVNFQTFGERREHYWQIGPSGNNLGLRFAALVAREMVLEPQSAVQNFSSDLCFGIPD